MPLLVDTFCENANSYNGFVFKDIEDIYFVHISSVCTQKFRRRSIMRSTFHFLFKYAFYFLRICGIVLIKKLSASNI